MKKKIHPNYISGFVNADGSFQINITRVNTLKTKYRVVPLFVITQHKENRIVLEEINVFFKNKGHLILDKRTDCYYLRFNTIKNINEIIIPHFIKYPIYGQK